MLTQSTHERPSVTTTPSKGRPKCPRPECGGYVRVVKDRALGVSYAVCVSCGHDVDEVPGGVAVHQGKTVQNDTAKDRPSGQASVPAPVESYVVDGKVPPPNCIGVLSDKECSELAIKLRWPLGPVCPYCNSRKVSHSSERQAQPLYCNQCHKVFGPRTRTFFNRTLTIRGWLYVIAVATHNRRVITIEQLKIAPSVRSTAQAVRVHSMFTAAMKQTGAWISHNTPEEVARKIFNLAVLDDDLAGDDAQDVHIPEQPASDDHVAPHTEHEGETMPDQSENATVAEAVAVNQNGTENASMDGEHPNAVAQGPDPDEGPGLDEGTQGAEVEAPTEPVEPEVPALIPESGGIYSPCEEASAEATEERSDLDETLRYWEEMVAMTELEMEELTKQLQEARSNVETLKYAQSLVRDLRQPTVVE